MSTNWRCTLLVVAQVALADLLVLVALIALIAVPTSAWAQLGSPDTQLFTLGMPGTGAALQSFAELGGALAAGDFDCDGFDDLAVGVPRFDFDGDVDTGAVLVLYGGAAGLHPLSSQWLTPPALVNDLTRAGGQIRLRARGRRFRRRRLRGARDRGAFRRARGRTGGRGGDDLPRRRGGACSPATPSIQSWAGGGTIPGAIEAGDHFGETLLAHDFDRDGYDDLAIGVPREDIGAVVERRRGACPLRLLRRRERRARHPAVSERGRRGGLHAGRAGSRGRARRRARRREHEPRNGR